MLYDGLVVPVVLVVDADGVVVGGRASPILRRLDYEFAVNGVLQRLSQVLVGEYGVVHAVELLEVVVALQVRVSDVHVDHGYAGRGSLGNPDVGIARERSQRRNWGCEYSIYRARLERLDARDRLRHVEEDHLVGVWLALAPVVGVPLEDAALGGIVVPERVRFRAMLFVYERVIRDPVRDYARVVVGHIAQQEGVGVSQVQHDGAIVRRIYGVYVGDLAPERRSGVLRPDAVEGELYVGGSERVSAVERDAVAHLEGVLSQVLGGRPGLRRPGRDLSVEPVHRDVVYASSPYGADPWDRPASIVSSVPWSIIPNLMIPP